MHRSTKRPQNDHEILRDGIQVSPWQRIDGQFDSPLQHKEETVYDVLVVGGGITGITTALLLQLKGKKCIVAEGNNIGFGTTGGTSAHLNTFFDTTYDEIEQKFGKKESKLVAKAGKEAFKTITDLVKQFKIDCDLENKDGIVFSENEGETEQLTSIYESSKRAGIAVREVSEIPVPVSFEKAYLFSGQGQFHPAKYLYALAEQFTKAGGIILENSFVRSLDQENSVYLARTDGSSIKALNVFYATHHPPGVNLLNFRCAPYRSYVLGVTLENDDYPEGLAYDMKEPYHYFRTHIIAGKKLLLLGGEDHKTGHGDPEESFKKLEEYCRKNYKVSSVDYKWSSQYYVPVDGLPYIGAMPDSSDSVFAATGFNGNGMMFGTLSALIIRDLIIGRKNEYADLFSPSRSKPIAGFSEFVKENADVAYHFVADRLSIENLASLKDIKKEDGKVVDYQNEKVALYRDKTGDLHALNPVCTHAKCIVNFNKEEQSWDCPCHGGRFDVDGKVLTGPPRQDLKKIPIK